MEHLEQPKIVGGNTSTPTKKRCVPSKKWCFTMNNPEDGRLEQLERLFESFDCDYIIGREVGEQGTPHLQGYLESDTRIRPVEKFQITNAHWERAKGDRLANLRYCSKDGDFVHSPGFKPPRWLKLIKPRGWQLDVVRVAEAEPDDRTIHWYWEQTGGTGKTSLCKYLIVKHRAIVLGGKATDIKHGIMKYFEENGCTPELIVVNFVRSMEQYVSYEGLETIKDMCLYSPKYEGGQVCGPCPTLIVMANFPPLEEKLSADRWRICAIEDTESTQIRGDASLPKTPQWAEISEYSEAPNCGPEHEK